MLKSMRFKKISYQKACGKKRERKKKKREREE